MTTPTPVKSLPATPELCEYLGDGPGVVVAVYAVPGGYVFTYEKGFSGHDLYAPEPETPYATVEAAVEGAMATDDDAGACEFEGDLGDLLGD